MGIKEKLAATKKQQEITKKVFSNSVIADLDGNPAKSVTLGGKYLLYSKETNKKIGWIQLAEPGKASVGWVNLPSYMAMKEPKEVPTEFQYQNWDIVDLEEYGIEDPVAAAQRTPEDELRADFSVYLQRAMANNMDNKDSRGMLINLRDIDRCRASFDEKHPGVRTDMIDSIDKYVILDHIIDKVTEQSGGVPNANTEDGWMYHAALNRQDEIKHQFESKYGIDIMPFAEEVKRVKYEEMDPIYGDRIDSFDYRKMREMYADHVNIDKKMAANADLSDEHQKFMWSNNRTGIRFGRTCCNFMEATYRDQYHKEVYDIAHMNGPAYDAIEASDQDVVDTNDLEL